MNKKYLLCKQIIFIFLISSTASLAQTFQQRQKTIKNYNVAKLTALSKKLKVKSESEKLKAIQIATQKGWPIKKILPNGAFIELQRVVDGHPIYYTTTNTDAAISTRTNHLHSGGTLGLSLHGQNMTAHVWDSGLALGSHQEYDGLGGTNRYTAGDESNNVTFHATHVTGTIISSGVDPKAKGMAPYAKAVGYDWNNDLSEATAAAAEGMLISNHSYGFRASEIPDQWFGAYRDYAAGWDNLQFNAPYYLMVVSAGNNGRNTSSNEAPLNGNSSYDKLSGRKIAKNNLVVANAQDANVDADGNLISVLINSGSSQGPTDDLRIKPDITGNGTSLYSTSDSGNTTYSSASGTSMASPNVAGSLLLLQEHYNNLNGNFMKAATLKGLALHTADDAGITGPDVIYGWGLLNTKRAAQTITLNGTLSTIKELTLTNGQTYQITVDAKGVDDLMASISWTDRPGEIVTALNSPDPVLVNDLDIRVTKASTTYTPWKLTGIDTNGQGDNNKDPYERIDVPNAAGSYTITVTHKGALVGGSQDFSLIISGATDPNAICNAHTPVNLDVHDVGYRTAKITWNRVPSTLYNIRYRQIGTSSWTYNLSYDYSFILSGLSETASYEVQVNSECNNGSISDYSPSVYFTTGSYISTCNTIISSYPYAEGFESNAGWTQVDGDDGDWARTSNATLSINTGPDSAIEGDFYMFLEASNNDSPNEIGSNATAILESQCFDLSNVSATTFSFQHHMYGQHTGSLTVQIQSKDHDWIDIWSLSGDQGNQWNTAEIDLSTYAGTTIKLRIIGVTGNGYASDIAIDDLALTTQTAVDAEPPSAPANLSADNIVQNSAQLSWEASTDNIAVTAYEVFVNGVLTGSTTNTSYTLEGLTQGTTYSVAVLAKDAAGNASEKTTVNLTTPAPIATVLDIRVGSGQDDVEETENGKMYMNSSDLELIYDSYQSIGNQTVGIRFANLGIPQGAVIDSAYIQFTADETDHATTSLTIKGHNVDDSEPFTTSNLNVSGRSTTTAAVSWNPPAWNTVGRSSQAERTPELKAIAQEIVDRPGWSTDSHMTFIITGIGSRVAESYEGSKDNASKLHIVYTTSSSYQETSSAVNAAATQSDHQKISTSHHDFLMFPNPVSDFLNIRLIGSSIQQVEVYTASGVKARNIQVKRRGIDVSRLKAGIYTIIIKTEEEPIRRRFVKQ